MNNSQINESFLHGSPIWNSKEIEEMKIDAPYVVDHEQQRNLIIRNSPVENDFSRLGPVREFRFLLELVWKSRPLFQTILSAIYLVSQKGLSVLFTIFLRHSDIGDTNTMIT